MTRDPASFCGCLFWFLLALGAVPASAQHLSVDAIKLASNTLSTGAHRLDGPLIVPSASTAGTIESVPADYFEDDRLARAEVAHDSDTVPRSDFRWENWIVVATLGLGFAFGLIVTLATLQRASSSHSPKRIF